LLALRLQWFESTPTQASPRAILVVFKPFVAYEMNGKPLSELHGAPLRLRNELELGFKQVKWLQAIEFVKTFKQLGSGEGGFNEDNEYFGYRAPI